MFALPSPRYEDLPGFRSAFERADAAKRLEAFETFIKPFHARLAKLIVEPAPDFEARIGAGDAALASLQRDGVALVPTDMALRAEVRRLTTPSAEKVKARLNGIDKPRFSDGQLMLDRTADADVFDAVEALFATAHVFEVACAYARRPVGLEAITLQVNTAASTEARYGKIDESGLPVRRAAYMHIDSALWPHHKALLYLSGVGADEGPFLYVPGSHRLADAFELAVRTTNDKLAISPDLFMALPPQFRAMAEFGGHLNFEASEAQDLLRREVALVGDGAELILFDYHGVHRGGFVRRGERQMLQCTFANSGR